MRDYYWAKDRRDSQWKRVKVLVRWRPGALCPRNVLIEWPDGTQVTRPFRGMRVEKPDGC